MVILLNLIVPFVLLVSCWLAWKMKKVWIASVGVILLVLYTQLQPSYMPKGEIKRSDIPAFESSDAAIEDRNKSPKAGSEYDKVIEQKIKEGLPFIEKD